MHFGDKSSNGSLYLSGFTAITVQSWQEILTQILRILCRASQDYREAINILHRKWSQPSILECDTDFDSFCSSWSLQATENTFCVTYVFQILQANLILLRIHSPPFLTSTRHRALNAPVSCRWAAVAVPALCAAGCSSPFPRTLAPLLQTEGRGGVTICQGSSNFWLTVKSIQKSQYAGFSAIWRNRYLAFSLAVCHWVKWEEKKRRTFFSSVQILPQSSSTFKRQHSFLVPREPSQSRRNL